MLATCFSLCLLGMILAGCTLGTNPLPPTAEALTSAPDIVFTDAPANTPAALTPQTLPTRTPLDKNPLVTPQQFLTPTTTSGTPLPPGTVLVVPGQEDDRYSVTVGSNQILVLNYNVEVQHGTVAMTLQGPDGIVWQKLFTTTENTSAEIPIKQGGEYVVLINIESLDGGYNLSWGFIRPTATP